MTIRPNDDPPPPANPPQSEGLFCPNCEYDLTGLTEPRCPECGEPFDREELIRWNDPETRLFGPLLKGAPDGTISYKRVFLGSLFAPRKLARDLSPVPGLYAARCYSVLTCAVTACNIFLTYLMVGGIEVGVVSFFVSPIVLLAAIISEVFIAKILARYVPPQNVPVDYRYRFWRTMCQCFSGHLCITIPTFILWLGRCEIWDRSSIREVVGLALLILVCLCFIWWWCNLALAIVTRGKPSGTRNLIVILIPFIATAGILIFVAPIIFLCTAVMPRMP